MNIPKITYAFYFLRQMLLAHVATDTNPYPIATLSAPVSVTLRQLLKLSMESEDPMDLSRPAAAARYWGPKAPETLPKVELDDVKIEAAPYWHLCSEILTFHGPGRNPVDPGCIDAYVYM